MSSPDVGGSAHEKEGNDERLLCHFQVLHLLTDRFKEERAIYHASYRRDEESQSTGRVYRYGCRWKSMEVLR